MTDKVIGALFVDRAEPIGESANSSGRYRLFVKVDNESTEPIPVFTTLVGEVKIYEFKKTFSPGETAYQDFIVPTNTTRFIKRITLSSRREGTLKVYINSIQSGEKRVGPGNLNAEIDFFDKSQAAGETIRVEFTLEQFAKSTDVSAYLYCVDQIS